MNAKEILEILACDEDISEANDIVNLHTRLLIASGGQYRNDYLNDQQIFQKPETPFYSCTNCRITFSKLSFDLESYIYLSHKIKKKNKLTCTQIPITTKNPMKNISY